MITFDCIIDRYNCEYAWSLIKIEKKPQLWIVNEVWIVWYSCLRLIIKIYEDDGQRQKNE